MSKKFLDRILELLTTDACLQPYHRCTNPECHQYPEFSDHAAIGSQRPIIFASSVIVDPRDKASLEQQLAIWYLTRHIKCQSCGELMVKQRFTSINNDYILIYPTVVIVCIARYNDSGNHIENRPLSSFNDSVVKLCGVKYKIASAIQHFGDNLHSGHYVAWVNSAHGWLKLDDTNPETPVTRAAFPGGLENVYLLFLEKITDEIDRDSGSEKSNRHKVTRRRTQSDICQPFEESPSTATIVLYSERYTGPFTVHAMDNGERYIRS